MSRYTALIGLFNRRRLALMSMELLVLREEAMGPSVINALLDAGHLPESLPALTYQAPGTDYDLEIFLNEYITQLAFGDAILRHRGELSEIHFGPAGPLDELIAFPPMWKHVFAHVEKELQKGGKWAGDPAWAKDYVKGKTWRTRLETALERLENKFLEIARGITTPHNCQTPADILKGSTNAAFEEALAAVKPLPAHLVAAANAPSLDGPTREYLEAVRQRGASALAVLGRWSREAGNNLVKEANDLAPGRRRTEAYNLASDHYLRAGQVSEHCVVAACNCAHLFLTIKNYSTAEACAESAVNHYHRLENDPQTFAAKRANIVWGLQTSRLLKVPPELMRRRTPEQVKAEKLIAWKSYMRLARAHAGQCREHLASTTRSVNDIRIDSQAQFDSAEKAYRKAYSMEPTNPEPLQELRVLSDEHDEYTLRAVGALPANPSRGGAARS